MLLPDSWVFPADVEGWLEEDECRELCRRAVGTRVLEIGSYQGKSTCALAQVASHLDAIDAVVYGHGAETVLTNLQARGLASKVSLFNDDFRNVLPALSHWRYGVIFLDADHGYDGTRDALKATVPLLATGGILAMHDWGHPAYPGLMRAMGEFFARHTTRSYLVGTTLFIEMLSGVPR